MTPLSLLILAALVVIGILLTGFFAGAETAFISSDKAQLRAASRRGDRRATMAVKLLSHPERLLSATLVASNLATVAAASVATLIVGHVVSDAWRSLATTLVLTPLILVFGEFVPKSIAYASSEAITLRIAMLMRFSLRLMNPVVVVVNRIADALLALVGSRPTGANPYVSREELIALAGIGEEHGLIEPDERRMIQSALELRDRPVASAMVPLVNMASIELGATVSELEDLAARTGFSRFPVHQERVDNVIGIVSFLDIVHGGLPPDPAKATIDRYVQRDISFVPETKPVGELLHELRYSPMPMAIIVDERGGVVGLATTQDLVEEIVGRIRDERHEQARCVVGRDGIFECDGQAHLEDLAEQMGLAVEDRDFETVAGFVIKLTGRIPQVGDVVKFGPYLIEILEADPRRIKRLRFIRTRPAHPRSRKEASPLFPSPPGKG